MALGFINLIKMKSIKLSVPYIYMYNNKSSKHKKEVAKKAI